MPRSQGTYNLYCAFFSRAQLISYPHSIPFDFNVDYGDSFSKDSSFYSKIYLKDLRNIYLQNIFFL